MLALGSVTVDFSARTVTGSQRALHLTEQEFLVLQYLAERRDRVVDRDELLSHVWGYPEVPMTRSVDHAIARLRKKLEPEPHHQRSLREEHRHRCLTLVTQWMSSSFSRTA